jgi:succinate dehydrogenase/fumarate reductase flavoprotein subunit
MSATTPASCDVLVIGSGAGGLSAAISARLHGLDVLVVEKAAVFGGTTAWSGGWVWIPGNGPAARAGVADSIAAARAYLADELGSDFDAERVDAFLAEGPRMVEFFEERTAVEFIAGTAPDFHPASAGCGIGRAICAAPFDGRQLGSLIAKLRPPMREITFAGMAIGAGQDLRHFMNVTRSRRSALHAARRLGAHVMDVARHRRNMHLVNGNALAARLLLSAVDAGIRLWESTPARRLLITDGAVGGAIVATADGDIRITARRGVVLACGGFPHDVARRMRLFPKTPTGLEHWSAAAPGNTGDGLDLAASAGAAFEDAPRNPAAWCAVSMVPRRDGSFGIFPHLIDRARPGVIAVTANGQRFVNEADSYHDFAQAMITAADPEAEVAAWLICDHLFLRHYGLGFAKPFPVPLTPYLRSGYLQRASTLADLARQAGIDSAALVATVDGYNRDARDGRDTAFHRGGSPFNRFGGDPLRQPNPCIAPVERAPFYAVKVLPGSLGTFAGVRTDRHARVLRADASPIPGLYAVGNDMDSVMGGHYPSGGITLGPAMTFGYIAGRHLAG